MKKFIILKLNTSNYIRAASTEKAYALKPYKNLVFLAKKYCRLLELPESLQNRYRWCLEIPEEYANRYANVQEIIKDIQESNAMVDAYLDDRAADTMQRVREILDEQNPKK
tara:strand:+ start:193 stop:525 length:333 start_codon:yes stop_codon:yes gene_type:complete